MKFYIICLMVNPKVLNAEIKLNIDNETETFYTSLEETKEILTTRIKQNHTDTDWCILELQIKEDEISNLLNKFSSTLSATVTAIHMTVINISINYDVIQ